MTEDAMHEAFNEAYGGLLALRNALALSGYQSLASEVAKAAVRVDKSHHDYTELILDPA